MGSILHPVGPLPPGAYWLRRIVALLLVALVGFLGFRVLSGGSSKSAADPSGLTTPLSSAPAVTPAASRSPSPKPSTKVSVTPRPSATAASSAAPTTCAAGAIRVQASTDVASYPSSRRPVVTIAITNTGKVGCLRNVGQSAVSLTITSGGVRIWSSEDCAPGGPLGPRLISPGGTVSKAVLWTRLKSKIGCPAGLPSAAPGAYDLVATNDGIASPPVRFILL